MIHEIFVKAAAEIGCSHGARPAPADHRRAARGTEW